MYGATRRRRRWGVSSHREQAMYLEADDTALIVPGFESRGRLPPSLKRRPERCCCLPVISPFLLSLCSRSVGRTWAFTLANGSSIARRLDRGPALLEINNRSVEGRSLVDKVSAYQYKEKLRPDVCSIRQRSIPVACPGSSTEPLVKCDHWPTKQTLGLRVSAEGLCRTKCQPHQIGMR